MLKIRAYSIIFLLTGVTILAGFGDSALAGGKIPIDFCDITIAKVAPGAGNTEFPFEVILDGGEPFSASLTNEQLSGGPFFSSVTVTELPLEGWVLENIDCGGDDGISFSVGDDNFTAICNSIGSTGSCTFFNQRTVSDIPTLSEWGVITAAAGLGLIGLYFALRRRRVVI